MITTNRGYRFEQKIIFEFLPEKIPYLFVILITFKNGKHEKFFIFHDCIIGFIVHGFKFNGHFPTATQF